MSAAASPGVSPPLPAVIFEGSFRPEGQRRFAELSGDSNPIHLDAARARREFYGRRILHGLHGAMRAIDALLGSRSARGLEPVQLTGIRARFLAPVFLGEPIQVVVTREDAEGAALLVQHGMATLYDLAVRWAPGAAAQGPAPGSEPPRPDVPTDLDFAALAGRQGTMPLSLDASAFTSDFPRLARSMPLASAAAALAVTRLVGMECPGTQSLLSSFDLRLDGPSGDQLTWQVTSATERFSLVKMSVAGGGISGTVDAFYRPRPEAQPSLETLRQRVAANAFSGMRVLVLGGSRGLGEACAKLLAAGGADVTLTWHRLGAEARRVAAEMQAAGLTCRTAQWDACAPERGAATLRRRNWHPTHVIYCATPRLELRRAPGFSAALLGSLTKVGVTGLDRSLRALQAGRREPLHVLVPSTALLDGAGAQLKGQAEFVSAKGAVEAYCAALPAQGGRVSVTVARLPRLRTDQSQALSPRVLAEPADAILPFLRGLPRGEPA